MGNTVASAKTAPPLDLLSSVPEVDTDPKPDESSNISRDDSQKSYNPGTFEELPRKVSDNYTFLI